MNNLDYELGFASADEDDWNNADGIGVAKAVLLACNTKCNVAHPFNKSKRLGCKGKCAAAFSAKIAYINANTATVTADASAAAAAEAAALATDAAAVEAAKLAAAKAADAKSKAAAAKAKLATAALAVDEDINRGSDEKKAGLGTGAMIGIGVGAVVLILGAVYFMRKK